MKQREARSHEDGNARSRVQSVPFSGVPGQSRLFIEYLRDPLALSRYYPNAITSPTAISSYIPEVLANYKTNRGALCKTLTEINSGIGCGEKTFNNIELLREADTVAVVTGQQAGLFTGPLYTIYKALSAIRMAEYLNGNGQKAVPVFWVATEDHDFDEVSHTFFIGNSGDLIETAYQPSDDVKDLPVGKIELDASIAEAISKTFSEIPQTEFSAEIRNSIESAWKQGDLFASAFATNLADMFGKFGLIFIDPLHDRLKSLAAPIYVEAIERSNEIIRSIRRRKEELEADGFHAQVLVEEDYFPLFWHDDAGRRIALRKTGENTYRAKGESTEFTRAELAAIVRDDPGRFSPGVMLRPVVQDALLPTVCYFGGAAEIAYFAQNSEVYRCLGRPATPILHRQSFTVVEAKHRRTLEKCELNLADLFAGFDETLESIGRKQLSSETAALFSGAEAKINTELDGLDQNISQIDATLGESLSNRRRKILYHIAALRKKAYVAQIRKDETLVRQVRAAFNALLPNCELQERVLNVHTVLNKYGRYFIDLIYDAIDLNDRDHRVVEL